jgi:hypothetical protein
MRRLAWEVVEGTDGCSYLYNSLLTRRMTPLTLSNYKDVSEVSNYRTSELHR